MTNNYISRADAVAAFEKVEDLYDPEWGNKRYTPDDVEEIINDVPAADVRPVERHKWHILDTEFGLVAFVCSGCYFIGAENTDYCPNCGAYMRPREADE